MKKRLIISILISFLFSFELSSCNTNSTIEGLEIHDLYEGFASLNPLLTWNNDEKSNYIVTINNDSLNQKIGTFKNVTSPYSLGGYLDSDTTYTVKVTNKKTKKNNSITFTTMKEGGNKMDSQERIMFVYGAYDNNMVIQRDKPFIVKGFAKKGVQVSVVLDNDVYTTISNGNWDVTIPGHAASNKGSTLKVIISNSVQKEFKDILFGDVFLVAGQSNIQWPIKDSDYQDDDLNIDSQMVRFFAQDTSTYPVPTDKFSAGKWFIYDKNDAGNQLYTAIGLMVGSMLSKELKNTNVPIGIMYAAQGDTNISKWIDASYYHGNDAEAGYYYNSMVYPFRGLNIKGVIWYQGCNDSSKAIQYSQNLLDLFSCYRNLFNDHNLPFYVVQLPCFDGDDGNKFNFAYVRDAQYKACFQDENAYLIATCDGGDIGYIHPRQKRYICERLTKSILATSYGYSCFKEGPSVSNISFENGYAIIEVNNNVGLHSETCKGFVLSGEDGRFHDATAKIESGKIIVSSLKVSDPVYVRYGFSRSPFLDIYNEDGYLMSPFRSDDYDRNIDIFDYDNLNSYILDPNGADFDISLEDGKLIINKPTSEINYSAVNINRWSPVNHTGVKFRFSYQGTGSNAEIQIRFIESSYEIWSFSFTDDSSDLVSKEVNVSDYLKCTYNSIDEVFNYESIMQVGLLIKGNQEVKLKVFEARFI